MEPVTSLKSSYRLFFRLLSFEAEAAKLSLAVPSRPAHTFGARAGRPRRGLPEFFVGLDFALCDGPGAFAAEVGLPALIEDGTIAGVIAQVVAFADLTECFVKIEAVFVRPDGDGIEILTGGENESGEIGIEDLSLSALPGFE